MPDLIRHPEGMDSGSRQTCPPKAEASRLGRNDETANLVVVLPATSCGASVIPAKAGIQSGSPTRSGMTRQAAGNGP